MKKILVFGAFDILHPGHMNFFEQAKKHGDHLTVIVGRDKNIEQIKKKKPTNHETTRLTAVESITIVDYAALGYQRDKYKIIMEMKPDIICLGYDQITFTDQLDNKLKELGVNAEVIRLKPFHPEKYKSSKLK